MRHLITLCVVIVGLINFAPLAAIVSASAVESAYQVTLPGDDLAILMRHRALLFGIVGGFVLLSALRPALRRQAMIMAAISMLGFAVLMRTGEPNAALAKVLVVDYAGLFFLALAVALQFQLQRRR